MISVVMSYYKRPEHLKVTLESYNYFYKDLDFEVIVIEDSCGDSGKECKQVLSESGIQFKHEVIDRSGQKYRNPGSLWNRGVEIATGDIIHITNPENLHVGPILTHCLDYITRDNYLVYACRTLKIQPYSFEQTLINLDEMTNWGEAMGWYQHSVIYNRLLHFASVISKDLFLSIGGFDSRFNNGVGYEDNDFIMRIKSKNINVLTFDEPFAAHQMHDRGHWKGEGIRINYEVYKSIWGESVIEHWRD